MTKKLRTEEEKEMVEKMIRIYCRKKEGNHSLCPQCQALLNYAHRRLDACRFGQNKIFQIGTVLESIQSDLRNRLRKNNIFKRIAVSKGAFTNRRKVFSEYGIS